MKLMVTLLSSSLILAGCASAENRAMLARMERNCAAGFQQACANARVQQKINDDEASANAWTAVGVGILLPLAIVGAAASQPQNNVCWNKHIGYYAC
jgi:hypothetical protein